MLKTGTYEQKSPVLFGSGTVSQLGKIAKDMGATKALIVTDANLVNLGYDKKAVKSLQDSGIQVEVWDGSESDAPKESVIAGVEAAKKFGPDIIVGLGGGSPMDTAKLIAAAYANSPDVLGEWYLYISGQKQLPDAPTPLIMVPTTAGTGSESTFVAVITDPVMDTKGGFPVTPSYAIVDPEFGLNTPDLITAFCGFDAFSHASESLTAAPVSPHSELLALEAIRLINKWLPVAIAEPDNLEARENMAFAANLAGIAFSESSVHMGHSIAHGIGHHLHIPHGIACAWTAPAVIEFTSKEFPEQYRKVAAVMDIDVSGVPDAEVGKVVADAVRALMKKTGIPTMEEKGTTPDKFRPYEETISKDTLIGAYGGKVTPEDVIEIIERMYSEYK